MTLIVYHLHKLAADIRVTEWPLRDAHQCHTFSVFYRAYLKESGHMPF